jgi:hypothetical protein
MRQLFSRKINTQRAFFIFARLCFALFVLLTSLYLLMNYIPLTRNSIIKLALVGWLQVFVKYHPLLYWIALALASATLRTDLRRPETRRLAIGFILFHLGFGILLLFRPLLSELPEDGRSFVWSLIALFPLLWLVVIDYAGHDGRTKWPERDRRQLAFSTAALSALFLSLLYVAVFYLRYVEKGIVSFRRTEMLVAVGWSIASHLLIFTLIFVVIKMLHAVSGKFSAPARVEFLLRHILASILGMLIFRKVIFAAISFNNTSADLFSISISLTLAAFLSGLILRLRSSRTESTPEAVGSKFRWLTNRQSLWLMSALCLAYLIFVALLAYAIPASIATTDWNSLMQHLSVILVWILTFIFFSKVRRAARVPQYSILVLLLIATASVGGYRAMNLSRSVLPNFLHDQNLDPEVLLEQYAGYDISFGIAHKILSPAEVDPEESTPERDAFYQFLEQNTEISPSIKLEPVEIKLVDEWKPAEGKRPNVFIFVIDSLRRDYLSPYNASVSFTPSIEKFSHDSIVMENAFTHYGGTALSAPSIWTGALQLHKLKTEPDYASNSLQNLVEADGYESFVTIDPHFAPLIKPTPSLTELDQGRDWMQHEFCRTIEELEQKLDQRQAKERPVFAYTQPQNVHLIALKNSGYVAPAGEDYPGFDTVHAARIKQMDACFGKFIQHLKSRGLYDDSIIILTSDHGDSLGEEGRWGHGPSVFPEVIRVPLIIHLPPSLEKNLVWDTKEISFLTDITPSLYYLLGHRPLHKSEIFGRPLFTETEEERKEYLRETYLVASSYGPVYGILRHNGDSLFIADAANDKEYSYDLTGDFRGAQKRLTPGMRADNEALIRRYIQSISQFYNFDQSRKR